MIKQIQEEKALENNHLVKKEELAKKLLDGEISIYDLSMEEIEAMNDFFERDIKFKKNKIERIKKQFVKSYLDNKRHS